MVQPYCNRVRTFPGREAAGEARVEFMLKRPIEGTKGPAQSALLMITHSKMRILRS